MSGTESQTENRDPIRKKEEIKRGKLSLLMSHAELTGFVVYFLVLMMASGTFLVFYFVHPSIEEKISALNATLTNDIKEQENIKSKSHNISTSKFDVISNQTMTKRFSQLEDKINQTRNQFDLYQKEEKFLVPFNHKFDFFYLSIVKNFVIVALCGLLGSTIASFRSLSAFYGQRKLRTRWATYYIFRPWQGLLLATIVFVIIRSGIQAGIGISSDQIAGNLFIVAATGLVVGLYSDEVYSKFHEVFESLFKTNGQKTDSLASSPKYPSAVREIVDKAIFPDEVEVHYFDKNPVKATSTPCDERCPGAFTSGESYWQVIIREGKDGIFWIRNSDQQIVCQHKITDKENANKDVTPPPVKP